MGISVSRVRLSLLAVGVAVALSACGGGDDGPAGSDPGATPGDRNPPSSPDGGSTPGGGLPGTGSPGGSVSNPPDGSGSGEPGGEPVVENSPPRLAGTPPPIVLHGTQYVFQPEATDDDGDILHFSVKNPPPWAKFEPTTGRLHGTPSAADVGTYADIRISVTDGAADAALAPFSITVTSVANGAVELSWTAPTENVDGSPLTDLAGYKIYWGTQPGEFTNSVTIDNPAVVTYVLENLVPATYYFVATAFNSEGAESDPSDTTSLTIS